MHGYHLVSSSSIPSGESRQDVTSLLRYPESSVSDSLNFTSSALTQKQCPFFLVEEPSLESWVSSNIRTSARDPKIGVAPTIDPYRNFSLIYIFLFVIQAVNLLYDPSPGLFILSCIIYCVGLLHMIKDAHNQKLNDCFLLLGAVMGATLGIWNWEWKSGLLQTQISYLPWSVLTSQALSLLVECCVEDALRTDGGQSDEQKRPEADERVDPIEPRRLVKQEVDGGGAESRICNICSQPNRTPTATDPSNDPIEKPA